VDSSATTDPTARVDRDAAIPDQVRFFVDQIAAHFAKEKPVPVRVSLQNTIRMQHRTAIGPNAIEVVLDWGQLERVLMFGHFAWALKGERLWKQKVTGYLEQEIYLVGARHAAIAGLHGFAMALQRRYSNFEFADLLPRRLDVQGQSQEFVWYLIFVVYRELGRVTLPQARQQILDSRPNMFPDADPDDYPDDETLVDLHLDTYGLNTLVRRMPEAISRNVLAELILYVSIDDLIRRASLVAPAAGGFSTEFGFAFRHLGAWVHGGFRIRQLGNRSIKEASKASSQALADDIGAGAEFADHYATFLDRALTYGLPRLREQEPLWRKSHGVVLAEGELFPVDDDRFQIHASILAFEDS
jgi:hypothetical protein